MAAERTLIGAETGIKRSADDSRVDVLLATPGEMLLSCNRTKRPRQSHYVTGAGGEERRCFMLTTLAGEVEEVSKPEATISGYRDDVMKKGRVRAE